MMRPPLALLLLLLIGQATAIPVYTSDSDPTTITSDAQPDRTRVTMPDCPPPQTSGFSPPAFVPQAAGGPEHNPIPAQGPVPKPVLDESNQAVSALRNYEQEARAYYGKTLNHLKKAEFGEAFDLFAAKLERFFPGMFSKELLAKLRGSQQISEVKKVELQNEVTQQAQAYFNTKALSLAFNFEAAGYLLSTSTTFNDKSTTNTPVLRPYLPDFASARKQFDALSINAKKALIAYVKVFDDIVVHLKGFCENLPGFEECDKVRALS